MTSIDRTPFCGSYSREVFGQNGLPKGFTWAEMIVVVADATFASKANIKLIRQWGYFLVLAFAWTWRFENEQALKDLVNHLPKKHYRRC